MKRVGLLILIMLVLSAVLYAQAITITLYTETSGSVVSSEADVNTSAWFRSTESTPGLSGGSWLVAGDYTGEVSRFTDGKDVIRIYGGPNNISRNRGIAIHIGNSPTDSSGCVVIAGRQIGGAMYTLFSVLEKNYGFEGKKFTIHVIDNRSPVISFVGTWIGVDNNYTWIFSGSNYTLLQNGVNCEKGTFSVNSNKTKFTQNGTHYWSNGTWLSYTGGGLVSDLSILSNNRFRIIGNNGEPYSETYEKR